MADEAKKESKISVATIGKVILGIVLIVVGVLLWLNWRWSFLVVLKGCLGPFLVLAGLIALAIAKE